jgi:hypothetical protein
MKKKLELVKRSRDFSRALPLLSTSLLGIFDTVSFFVLRAHPTAGHHQLSDCSRVKKYETIRKKENNGR